MFHFAPEKVVSHIAEDLRLLARENGYPPALCEAMVNKNQEVFECTHADGRVDFFSEAELRSRADGKDWKQGQLVFRKPRRQLPRSHRQSGRSNCGWPRPSRLIPPPWAKCWG